jgi:hypothetical protein
MKGRRLIVVPVSLPLVVVHEISINAMVQKGNHERVVMSVSSESSGIDAVMVYVVGIREALSRVRTNGRLSNHGLAQVLHCACKNRPPGASIIRAWPWPVDESLRGLLQFEKRITAAREDQFQFGHEEGLQAPARVRIEAVCKSVENVQSNQ